MTKPVDITVAYGDGIGPEIMEATLHILKEAGALINPEVIEIGQNVYLRGVDSGIEAKSWESLRRTKVFLKAPITTPQGGGYKSLNVTTRKRLGLYANVRPCVAYHPFVETHFPKMDLVIVRENEEDLYAGIEHRQSHDVTQCLKLISRQGCEKISRYAFEYARAHNRKKVTCFVKDNIMKITDGLFHKVFDEVGSEYPEIEKDHLIVDIGAARIAADPERFDVCVMPNLYGDILSDIAAEVSGSVGLGGSVNLGDHCAMFEAIHGSAPDIAGKGVANPSGLLLGAVMMLVHIGQPKIAERVQNAWLRTLEEGIHTGDIFNDTHSKKRVGTAEFSRAVIERLGKSPEKLKPVVYNETKAPTAAARKPLKTTNEKKELVGVDVFLDAREVGTQKLAGMLKDINIEGLKLQFISNRGVTVWPEDAPETFCVDHWRCRFEKLEGKNLSAIQHKHVLEVLSKVQSLGLDFIKTEGLYTFDGKRGYSAE